MTKIRTRCFVVSSDINKTTTTQVSDPSKFRLTGENGRPLIYPRRLLDNQRAVADRYLRTLAPEQRQPILDELEGRFRSEQKGMRPVYDEIRFLHALCNAARNGKFQPNLGLKVLSRASRTGTRSSTSERSQGDETGQGNG